MHTKRFNTRVQLNSMSTKFGISWRHLTASLSTCSLIILYLHSVRGKRAKYSKCKQTNLFLEIFIKNLRTLRIRIYDYLFFINIIKTFL